MIAFGLRLTLRGGREAIIRLLVTGAAVSLGVAVLLATLGALNAVQAQNDRSAWLNSGSTPGSAAGPGIDPLWATLGTDVHDGETITRVDIAATGLHSPVPPGLPRLPGPGEYYASPALAALLDDVPAAELADRYPGRRIGTVGAAALPGPDSLLVVVGHASEELSGVPGAVPITDIATESPADCGSCPAGTSADAMALILAITAAALLFPVLVFIGTATRLSAARREQRFAAMRLVGATPRQVTLVAAVEAGVAAVAGTAVGCALFLALRGPLAGLPLTGETFYPGDLSLGPLEVLLVVLGVPLAAAGVALLALRRVRISPLGVTRRVTPLPPRAYRLIPLLAGVTELGWFVGRRPESTNGQIAAYLGGILVMMAGLVIAGPWLTMAGSRVMARRTSRPETLLAARRLADDPKAGFRAVSGLVLALFVASTAVGVMTTMIAERGTPSADPAFADTLIVDFARTHLNGGLTDRSLDTVPDQLLDRVREMPGVTGVAVVHRDPLETTVLIGDRPMSAALVSCAEFRSLSGLGSCPAGAEVVSVPQNFADYDRSVSSWSERVWPATTLSADDLREEPVRGLVVGTDGTTSGIERARTALAAELPPQVTPVTVAEYKANSGVARDLAGFQRLATVAVLGSLGIAGCSLAAGVAGGLNDRKRPFSLLRLAGVPLPRLRRVVALEATVPLLIVSVVACGAGLLAAALFLRSQLDYALRAPGVGFYVAVLAGLAVATGIIASTLPLLGRLTGPETARNE